MQCLINFLCYRDLRFLFAVTANDIVTRVKPRWPRVAALKIDLVYLCQEGSRKQVILDVRLVLRLLE